MLNIFHQKSSILLFKNYPNNPAFSIRGQGFTVEFDVSYTVHPKIQLDTLNQVFLTS